MSLKVLLLESISEEDASYEFFELYNELLIEALNDLWYAESDDIRQDWEVIPFHKLKRIWEQFVKHGFVRDEKTVLDFKDLIVKNIVKVVINNDLSGHSTHYPLDELKYNVIPEDEQDNYTYEDLENIFRKEWTERIFNYIYDDKSRHNTMRITDNAIDKLTSLASKLLQEQEPEKILVLIDQVLNVVHQRSDIAEWFIEGGSRSLDKLSGLNDEDEE